MHGSMNIQSVSYVIPEHQYIHNSSKSIGDENLDFILCVYFSYSAKKQVLAGEKERETNNEESKKNRKKKERILKKRD
jgi:hypothetical protein